MGRFLRVRRLDPRPTEDLVAITQQETRSRLLHPIQVACPRADAASGGAAELEDFRVVFVTQDDPFYTSAFFREFSRVFHVSTGVSIAAIMVLTPLNRRTTLELARDMYRFYGISDFVRQGLRYCWSRTSSVLWPARRWGLRGALAWTALLHVADINSAESLHLLRTLTPSLIISVAASQIFSREVLSIPRCGCINVHSGKLPEYRGMLPTFWQMLNGEPSAIVTVHVMAPKVDDGPIIMERQVPIRSHDTLHTLMKRTKIEAAHMLAEVIEQLRTGTVRLKPMPREGSRYYSFPKPEHVRQFRRMGRRLV